MTEKVSVIVVNWNGSHLLADCFAALSRQTIAPHQVIVVDNGSTDASRSWLEAQAWPWLEKIYLPVNRGFAGGNNAALPLVTGAYIALLNNDARPEPDWIAAGLRGFRNEQVGSVACKILRYDQPEYLDKAGHLIYADGLNRGRGTGHLAAEFDQPCEVLMPDGCAAFWRTAVIAQIGFFDEDFFLYGEDADLGLRARFAGWSCWYQPDSVVHHLHSASLGKFSPLKVYYIERNRLWVMLKNFPLSMIVVSPLATAWRFGLNFVSLLSGKGVASGFTRAYSKVELAKTLARAFVDGGLGLRKTWRKRAALGKGLSAKERKIILQKFAISAKELTLMD